MERVLAGIRPEIVFKHFEDISRIPRGSGNEKAVSDFIVGFARGLGLEVWQDEVYNAVIRVPGTPGATEEPLIFQGHLDMVCEKNQDVTHDFLKDPIELVVKDGRIRADGTTLGADNGTAVAMMMAMAQGGLPEHPPLELVFTTQEEVGLDGASHLDMGRLQGKRLVNLDFGGVGVFCAGCAGGVRTLIRLPLAWEEANGQAFRVRVRGLAGGHSGEMIHEGRGNANVVLGRLLSRLRETVDARPAQFSGGLMDNAIPRESDAVIVVKDEDAGEALLILEAYVREVKSDLPDADAPFSLTAEPCPLPDAVWKADCADAVSRFFLDAPNGVVSMSPDLAGLVQTSLNLGVMRQDKDALNLSYALRSSVEEEKAELMARMEACARAVGAEASHGHGYPGWTFRPDSPLLAVCMRVYEETSGKAARCVAVHGGLECGLFLAKKPGLDMIALGAESEAIHTPDENLDPEVVVWCWEFLKVLAARLAKG